MAYFHEVVSNRDTEMLQEYLALQDPLADILTIELVFAEELSASEVGDAVARELPDAAARVSTAFGGETDRFFFVEFPFVRSRGREPEVFAFARAMRATLGATDANPVLSDSLYGAAALGQELTEAALFACETPRDNGNPFGWVHAEIGTVRAWQTTRGEGSTVAVIDTGYTTHRELDGAIRASGQGNFVEGGSDATDRFSSGFLKFPGHGTLVCSVVASRGTADAAGQTGGPGAVTGAAPAASILPIRAITSVIDFRQTTIPRAIAHAIAGGADVIAMALGGPTRVASTEKALRDARAAGLVTVCAAGNCWPSVVFPAAYAAQGLAVAVAATTRSRTPWAKSGRGPEVTVSAPGENVWGAAKNKPNDPDTGIRAAQGTTLATSLTGGVAALWIARHGGRAQLKAHADRIGTTVLTLFRDCLTRGLVPPAVWQGARDLGAGIVDADLALRNPLPTAVAEAAPMAADTMQSTSQILAAHLANHRPEAAEEFGPELEAYAPEILWLSYRAGARQRAVAGGAESLARPERASPGLERGLADRPALRAAVGLAPRG